MIEVENLSSGYDELNSFLHIDFCAFENGKISGILGLNGSGKTTLLKTLMGMIPFSGKVSLDGKDLKKISNKERASLVSYLPQKFPDVNMSVSTLVSHGRFPFLGFSKVLSNRDKELVENALCLTELQDKKNKNFMELSGGEKQRAYLAMIIAQNTKMILLDEFTTYMDLDHQLKVFSILDDLCKTGCGIVISSHDIPQCFSFCSKVMLLKNGKVLDFVESCKVAQKEDLIENALNVSLKSSCDENSLYKYVLQKNTKNTRNEDGEIK